MRPGSRGRRGSARARGSGGKRVLPRRHFARHPPRWRGLQQVGVGRRDGQTVHADLLVTLRNAPVTTSGGLLSIECEEIRN